MLSAHSGQGLPGSEKRFLSQIAGHLVITHQMRQIATERSIVLMKQEGKGVLISSPCAHHHRRHRRIRGRLRGEVALSANENIGNAPPRYLLIILSDAQAEQNPTSWRRITLPCLREMGRAIIILVGAYDRHSEKKIPMQQAGTLRTPHQVVFYTKAGCHLCDEARDLLEELAEEIAFELTETDIRTDMTIFEQYRYRIPVVIIDQLATVEGRIGLAELRRAFTRRQERS